MPAGGDLDRERVAVGGRAALDDVGDIAAGPVYGELLGEQLVQQLAGAPDEGLTGQVLVMARRLTDEHQVGGRVAGGEDHLGPARSKRTGNTTERDRFQLGKRRH